MSAYDEVRYGVIEPYDRGMLAVGDGNSIYWECCGNPNGKPAVYVHGGPGSGATVNARRLSDPAAYKIIVFDQRNCGRSRPQLTDKSQLQCNTTQHLVRDMELLRKYLEIDRWIMFGSSWGCTLTLAYAQAYPSHVDAIILACITTTSPPEVEWLTNDVGRIFPQQWERFVSHIPKRLKHLRIIDAYALLLFDDDPVVCDAAAIEWCAWEDAHVSLSSDSAPNRRFEDAAFRLRFARLVTHYWCHAAFLDEGALFRDASILDGIPGILLHGRYDVSSPLLTAWQLQKSWPGSELIMLDDGHGGSLFSQQIVAALNRFREA